MAEKTQRAKPTRKVPRCDVLARQQAAKQKTGWLYECVIYYTGEVESYKGKAIEKVKVTDCSENQPGIERIGYVVGIPITSDKDIAVFNSLESAKRFIDDTVGDEITN